MTDTDIYTDAVVERLRFWDAKVYSTRVGPLTATVGDLYRTSVRPAGSGTAHAYNIQLHHVVAVAALPSVDDPWVVRDFTLRANDLAYATTRGTPGLDTAEAGIGVLVTHHVDPSALPAVDMPGASRPVLVDLSTGWVYATLPRPFYQLFPLPPQVGIGPVGPPEPVTAWGPPPGPPPWAT